MSNPIELPPELDVLEQQKVITTENIRHRSKVLQGKAHALSKGKLVRLVRVMAGEQICKDVLTEKHIKLSDDEVEFLKLAHMLQEDCLGYISLERDIKLLKGETVDEQATESGTEEEQSEPSGSNS